MEDEVVYRIPKHGDAVIYHDTFGEPHNAILTDGCFAGAHSTQSRATGWCNVIFVSDDITKKDNYGRQIERECSVSHVSQTTAWGRYWRWPDEKPNEK